MRKKSENPFYPPGWQNLTAFRRGQNGHENFRQARIYNFCVFAQIRKSNSGK